MIIRSMRSVAAAAAFLGVAVAFTGCAVRQSFPEHDASQVWTAMEAVAQSPAYRDWDVVENNVYVNRDESRIRIKRSLERSLVQPGARPRKENRSWQFSVFLVETDPPTARFTTSSVVIPAQLQDEGRRYFASVRRLLAAEGIATAHQPIRQPEREAEVIDPGDLLDP